MKGDFSSQHFLKASTQDYRGRESLECDGIQEGRWYAALLGFATLSSIDVQGAVLQSLLKSGKGSKAEASNNLLDLLLSQVFQVLLAPRVWKKIVLACLRVVL